MHCFHVHNVHNVHVYVHWRDPISRGRARMIQNLVRRLPRVSANLTAVCKLQTRETFPQTDELGKRDEKWTNSSTRRPHHVVHPLLFTSDRGIRRLLEFRQLSTLPKPVREHGSRSSSIRRSQAALPLSMDLNALEQSFITAVWPVTMARGSNPVGAQNTRSRAQSFGSFADGEHECLVQVSSPELIEITGSRRTLWDRTLSAPCPSAKK
jgi:hypothetical protein